MIRHFIHHCSSLMHECNRKGDEVNTMRKFISCSRKNSIWLYVGAAFTVLILIV